MLCPGVRDRSLGRVRVAAALSSSSCLKANVLSINQATMGDMQLPAGGIDLDGRNERDTNDCSSSWQGAPDAGYVRQRARRRVFRQRKAWTSIAPSREPASVHLHANTSSTWLTSHQTCTPIVLISNSLSMEGAELRQEASTLHGARRGSFDGATCEHSHGMRFTAGRVVIGSLYAMCIPLWTLRPSASLRRSRLQAHRPSSLSTAVVSVSDQSTTSLR